MYESTTNSLFFREKEIVLIDNKRCILLVDDEAKMVRALSDLLKSKGYVILQAFDGQQAIDTYFQHNTAIDLVLLDVMMPIYDGFEVLSQIRKNNCLVPVIMLTAREEECDQLRGFKTGSDDYIAKPFSPALLVARIEAVMKRTGKDISREISAKEIRLNIAKRTCTCDNQPIDLTKREFDLLFFFATNQRITFTREQLLNQVWGYDFDGDTRTVDTHIKQLRIKLGEKSEYLKTIHRVGYKFEV